MSDTEPSSSTPSTGPLEQPGDEAGVIATRFTLNAEQWVEFLALLDAPPREHPRLRRLLTTPSIFEETTGPG